VSKTDLRRTTVLSVALIGAATLASFPVPGAAAGAAVYTLTQSEVEATEGTVIKFKIRRSVDTGAESVVWRTRDISATGHEDYQFIWTRTLEFQPGEMVKRIGLKIYDDAAVESTEQFRIELREAEGASTIGEQDTLRVSVLDNDGTGGNSPPSLGGEPDGVAEVGAPWAFTPSSSDADRDPLRFEIRNRPGWANFDPATGRLAGTPGRAGVFAGIVISASDGVNRVELPSFDIDVRDVATSTGSATLTWTPPNERTDGSALTDLAGYRVYHGPAADRLSLTAQIDNPGITSFMFEGLSAGQWAFTVTAIDRDGRESDYANVLVQTVN
jgi:hypothetical protein